MKFIFATTEYHKIPETILSRCQQFDFRMIPAREHAACTCGTWPTPRRSGSPRRRSASLARAAEGSVRDALSLFDQVLAFSGDEVKDEDVAGLLGLIDRELLHRASRAIVEGSSLAMLELVESLADYGADYRNFAARAAAALARDPAREAAPADSSLLAGDPAGGARAAARARGGALARRSCCACLDLLTQAEERVPERHQIRA